jgi:hypothetical protein
MGNRKLVRGARKLLCEQLESRCVLSAIAGGSAFHAVLVAGDPRGNPSDSPSKRVDPNTATSPFAGVGSLRISASDGTTYICTGTPIDPVHVLTAGHCVDIDDNGIPDITGLTFNLNLDTDPGTDQVDLAIPAAAWQTNPNFSGFSSPSINDDLTVVTLATPLPANVPTYPLVAADMVAGSTHLYMVGYGQSGDGVKGYYVNPSFTVKRVGENMADAFYGQDDAGQPTAKEVFRFDFDGKQRNTNTWGGGTLGNDNETTLGGGDSGGPSFVLIDPLHPGLATSYALAGVNTFTQGFNAPKFGSLGGGINVFPYESWILGPHATIGGGSGGSGSGSSTSTATDIAVLLASTTSADSSPAEYTGSPLNVGAGIAVSSPAAQSAIVVGTKESQGTGYLQSARDKFAGDSDDLLVVAKDTTGITDDAETDDFAPAVDEILRRWSV